VGAAIESPSRQDIDFYIRKTERLAVDLDSAQAEVTTLRHRLRKAEDYEIKCEYLAKQVDELEAGLTDCQADNAQLRLDNETLLKNIEEELAAKNELYQELTLALNECEAFKRKNADLDRRLREEVELVKNEGLLANNTELERARTERSKIELEFRDQIDQLKK
jgi:hypothetical protein